MVVYLESYKVIFRFLADLLQTISVKNGFMFCFLSPSKAHTININGSSWPIKKRKFTFLKLRFISTSCPLIVIPASLFPSLLRSLTGYEGDGLSYGEDETFLLLSTLQWVIQHYHERLKVKNTTVKDTLSRMIR